MTIKTFIIDDEPPAIRELEFLLKPHSDIEITERFTSPLKALKVIQQEQPHLVFLDINMPQLQGLDVASEIKSISPESHIIFVTAYDDFAVKAFEVEALDYLLKPIAEERLAKTMDRVRALHKNTPEKEQRSKGHKWVFSTTCRTLTNPQNIVTSLTTKETIFLNTLTDNMDKSVTRAELLDCLDYNSSGPYGNRSLDVLVTRLRKKILEETGQKAPIVTVHGYGYSVSAKVFSIDLV